MRRGVRASAARVPVAPELVDRFRADLVALWPFVAEDWARLGIAVSGGADSLALLLLAHAALPGRVEAATVDHQLRAASGEEAGRTAAYCAQLGVPHQIHRVEVARGNLQDRARAVRYAALGTWCEKRGLHGLATAHQLDDQVETVIMRLNRGSGQAGLAGIRALGTVRDAGIRLVRPLLTWPRATLKSIVRNAGFEPVLDPSNEDPAFDRARIRKKLASADWINRRGVARSAQLLAEADEAIEWMIGREYTECVTAGPDEAIYRAQRTGIGGTLVHSGVLRAIYRGFGLEIGRREAAGLVDRLCAGQKSNIAGVQAAIRDVAGERVWVFKPENPRKAT